MPNRFFPCRDVLQLYPMYGFPYRVMLHVCPMNGFLYRVKMHVCIIAQWMGSLAGMYCSYTQWMGSLIGLCCMFAQWMGSRIGLSCMFDVIPNGYNGYPFLGYICYTFAQYNCAGWMVSFQWWVEFTQMNGFLSLKDEFPIFSWISISREFS